MRPTRLAFAAVAALALPGLGLPAATRPAAAALATAAPAAVRQCDSSTAPAGRVIVLMAGAASASAAGDNAGLTGAGVAATTEARAAVLGTLARAHAADVTAFHLIDAVAATVSAPTACALARTPGVAAVVPDRQLTLDATALPARAGRAAVRRLRARPASTVTEPESLTITGASAVQAAGDSGQGVLVADIDSGIDTTQPNLQGVLATGAGGAPLYRDFTGTDLQDTVGHGTGTAGMMVSQGTTTYEVSTTPYYGPIGGDPTAVTPFRVLGMAPSAKLIVAKVFDARVKGGGGYESWIVSAIQWAVDNHAQVINESFGWQDVPTDATDPVALADAAAAAKGVVVCVAAGNSGPGFGTVADPAASSQVVSVGASTMFRDLGEDGFLAPYGRYDSDGVASFSSRGPTSDGRMAPDLLAPGENGWSVFAVSGPAAGAGVGLFGGTSQASPIAAGAFALAIEAYRAHVGKLPTVDYLKQLLMNTADDLGLDAEAQSSGRLDVARAVEAIDGTGPDVAISPEALDLSGAPGATATGVVTVTNHGSKSAVLAASLLAEQQASAQTFSGTTPASQTGAGARFPVAVPAGTATLTAEAVWRTSDGQPLLVEVFDPQGRLAQYASGGGIAAATVAHPQAGTWTVYVANQNAVAEPFELQTVTDRDVPAGTVSPSKATIGPGKSATVRLALTLPATAGTTVTSLKLQLPGGSETVPVISTVGIPSSGSFAGTFTSPSSSGLDAEVDTFDFTVPAGVSSLTASASWPDAGNGIELLLVDPQQQVVVRSKYSLTSTTTTLSWAAPAAGTWQLIVTCPVFDGMVLSVPYTGHIGG